MAYASKLCNPTPFPVVLPWDKGVVIRIPAFGDTTLEMQQMDDFKPGKPGSEEVQKTLDYYGLFLFDVDRPYDNQALEALERCRGTMKARYDATVTDLQGQRSRQGIPPDPEVLEETLAQMGQVTVRKKIETLTEQIKKYQQIVNEDHAVRTQLDPKRTIFVMEPPREFPSVAAMEFFLEQNEELAAKHAAFVNKREATEGTFEATPTTAFSNTPFNEEPK